MTAPAHRVDLLGGALALSASATFGAIPVLAKLAYQAGITTTQLQVFRFVTVTVGLVAVALVIARRPSGATLWRIVGLGLFGCLVYGPQSLLFFTALQTLPASFVELVFYIYPGLVVVGASIVYRRRITWRRALAVAMGTGGAALIVGLSSAPFGSAVIFALATPVVYAGYLLLAERLLRGIGAIVGTATVTGGACAFWLLLMAWKHEAIPVSLDSGWGLPVALVALASLWCVPALFAAVLRIGSDVVAVISTFEPLMTVFLAAIILLERLTVVQAIGATMILAAVVLIQWPSSSTPSHDTLSARGIDVQNPR